MRASEQPLILAACAVLVVALGGCHTKTGGAEGATPMFVDSNGLLRAFFDQAAS